MRDSNERLEFLGDAILGAVITDMLFKRFPYKDEGFLTEIRSRLVSRAHLNKLSRKLGIDKQLHAGRSENNPGRSMDGDALEALIGAIYLDKGYGFVQRVVLEVVFKLHVDMDEMERVDTNYKSRMIEWAQKEKKHIEFRLVEETGSGSKRQYNIELYIDDEKVGRGCDFSIKRSEQNAAEQACIHLGIIKNPYPNKLVSPEL
jgi:ribonuclease-3